MLHHYEFGNPQAGQTLAVLHGLFGSARNLAGICRHMSETMRVIAFDLPNHGRSPHTNDMSATAMATMLADSLVSLGVTKAHVLGHSLGGKVAMMLALKHTSLVDKLVVADIAPVSYPPHHNSILSAMLSMPDSIESRTQADAHLAATVSEVSVRQFLLQNLEKQGDYYRWRIPVETLANTYDTIRGADEFDECQQQPFKGSALFVRGALSDYVQSSHLGKIGALFPNYVLETLEGADHWLHADKPNEFNRLIFNFLHK